MKKLFQALCMTIAGGLAVSGETLSQAYPVKPIRVLSGSSENGPGGIALRLMAPRLGQSLGQPVIIEVRAGRNGTIAANYLTRVPPDGYNVMYASSGTFVAAPFTQVDLEFDPRKDFTPITLSAGSLNFLTVHASIPVHNVKEFVAYARRNPNKLSYYSNGVGSAIHLVAEAFKEVTKTELRHIPYAGDNISMAMNDLRAARLTMAFSSYSQLQPLGDSVRQLAVFDKRRFTLFPDIPSIVEEYPDYAITPSYWAFVGPLGMPPAIVNRLAAEIRSALNAPEIATKLAGLGIVPMAGGPEDLAAEIRVGYENMQRLTKAIGLKPQ